MAQQNIDLKPKKGRAMFWYPEVDGRYGLPELSRIAEANGVDIEKGDVAIFDNVNQQRRRALLRVDERSVTLVTVKRDSTKDPFIPMADQKGRLIRNKKSLLN